MKSCPRLTSLLLLTRHRHLLVKAAKLQLNHRRDSPTHHPFITVCSRVCLVSPCLNTEHKASRTGKTMPLNTQWMPFNCLFLCRLSLVRCRALSHHSVLCCASFNTCLNASLNKVVKIKLLLPAQWKITHGSGGV